MNEHIVDLRAIHKSFPSGKQELSILANLNLTIARGSSVVISGESGAGKSTLLHITGGLDNADSGTVSVAGHHLHALAERERSTFRNRHIGFIFQSYYLLSDFNARENVMMPALIGGAARSAAHQKAAELLEAVHLDERAEHFPHQLSGGEQQRIAFARALMNNPAIVLADEPTGNLDEENSRIIESMLFALVKNFNTTLLVVTHDQHLAQYADHHFILTHRKLQPA